MCSWYSETKRYSACFSLCGWVNAWVVNRWQAHGHTAACCPRQWRWHSFLNLRIADIGGKRLSSSDTVISTQTKHTCKDIINRRYPPCRKWNMTINTDQRSKNNLEFSSLVGGPLTFSCTLSQRCVTPWQTRHNSREDWLFLWPAHSLNTPLCHSSKPSRS